MTHYDAIVIGLGAMGSAALYHLSKQGAHVLGIDRYHPPHTLGSSHGESRMVRLAVGEGEAYIPFARRTHELWRELEAETGDDLLFYTGGYIICPKDGGAQFHGADDFVSSTAELARRYGIEHRIDDAGQIRNHMPMLKVQEHEHAYFEPTNGLVVPEHCVSAHLRSAATRGAAVHTNERVTDYHPGANSVTVTTDQATYHADKVILAAGAWVGEFMPAAFRQQLTIYRQMIFWFEADDLALWEHKNCAWAIWIGANRSDFFALFPRLNSGTPGVKVMTEHYDSDTQADTVNRVITQHDINAMMAMVQHYTTGIRPVCIKTATCLYTNTPDTHFMIDWHPDSDRVLLVSACSGHGFKHSAAIGEALAQLAVNGQSALDISPFSAARFSGGTAS